MEKNHKGLFRFDRDTHQITMKTGISSLVDGGPQCCESSSCKAGGLQRQGGPTTFIAGVFITSSLQPLSIRRIARRQWSRVFSVFILVKRLRASNIHN